MRRRNWRQNGSLTGSQRLGFRPDDRAATMAIAQRALDSTAMIAEIDRLADAGPIVARPIPGLASRGLLDGL